MINLNRKYRYRCTRSDRLPQHGSCFHPVSIPGEDTHICKRCSASRSFDHVYFPKPFLLTLPHYSPNYSCNIAVSFFGNTLKAGNACKFYCYAKSCNKIKYIKISFSYRYYNFICLEFPYIYTAVKKIYLHMILK